MSDPQNGHTEIAPNVSEAIDLAREQIGERETKAGKLKAITDCVKKIKKLCKDPAERGAALHEFMEIATADPAISQAEFFKAAGSGGHLNGYDHAIKQAPNGLFQHGPIDDEFQPDSSKAVLRLSDWMSRELRPVAPVLGHILTTTSRALLYAPTGLGKTMFGVAMAIRIAAGTGFLHWQGRGPMRVLYIDGEMSSRLLKQRLIDEARRLGSIPDSLFVLSHEDVANFAPLNTPEGQDTIDDLIKRLGGVDFVFFDNIMCLISGDMKEEEGWRQTVAWQHDLTKREIGQLWLHHTGHDTTHGYGTKTREWQMDTVIAAEAIERDDTDVSFKLTMPKARERTPATRIEFADIEVALVNDRWTSKAATKIEQGQISATAKKFLAALRDATIESGIDKMHGHPTASIAQWEAECIHQGLLDPKKPDSCRSMLSQYRLKLIAANWIACNQEYAWTVA